MRVNLDLASRRLNNAALQMQQMRPDEHRVPETARDPNGYLGFDFQDALKQGDREAWLSWMHAIEESCFAEAGPVVDKDVLRQEVAKKLKKRIHERRLSSNEIMSLSRKMVARTAIDLLRAANAKKRTPEDGFVFADEENEDGERLEIPSSGPLPTDEILRQEIILITRGFLAKMAPFCRALLILSFYHNFSRSELAEVLEKAEVAVRSDVFRCKEELETLIRRSERARSDKFWLESA